LPLPVAIWISARGVLGQRGFQVLDGLDLAAHSPK
jgi:hypothetical protein